jgi:hypothetical protein
LKLKQKKNASTEGSTNLKSKKHTQKGYTNYQKVLKERCGKMPITSDLEVIEKTLRENMILFIEDVNGKNRLEYPQNIIFAKKGLWIFGNLKEWQYHLEKLAFGC